MFQIKWIWHNMQGCRGKFIAGLFLSVIFTGMFLVTPIFTKEIVDSYIVGDAATERLANNPMGLVYLCVGMLLCVVLRAGLQYAAAMCYEESSQTAVYRIRKHCYQSVQEQDAGYFDRNRTGDIMTRVSGDLDWIRHAVSWIIRAVIESFTLFLAATIYFFILDWQMALCMLALTPLIFLITNLFKKRVGPMYVDLRERLSLLNTQAQENISGNRVVKAFARENHERERFDESSKNFASANKKAALTWLEFFPYLETTAQALSVVQLIVGGIFVINGRISFGTFTAFSGLIWTIANPMRTFGTIINDLQRFLASAQKVIEVYYAKPSLCTRHDAVPHPHRFKGEIVFDNVNFSYNKDTPTLKNINLHIKPGETVAIMGETGSGKSTLVNLIARFYDVNSGSITVDGKDVRHYPLEDLRRGIGMTTQEVLLYSDTVEGNICYGNSSLPEEEVKGFAAMASADAFISKMPEGYDTIIGERGVGLSGGQKQRIALARALAIKPSVLILDDTTSAVDMETEKEIQDSLAALEFPCSKIIIAQRISSTKDADQILIMKDGEIVERGTHDELVQSGGYYSEVFELQNGSMEEIRKILQDAAAFEQKQAAAAV